MKQEIFNQRLQAVTSSMEAFRVGPLSVKITNFHDSRRGAFTTTVHEHYYYEFCYVRNNSCIYQVQEQNIILQENDGRCVLIPSALPHLRKVTGKYNTLTGSTLAHLLINPFAPEYQLNLSMFREAIAKRNCQFRCSALFRMLESQLRSIVEKHEPYWQEYASCKLRELILSFFQENFPELPVNEGVAHVAKNQEVIGRLLYMIAVWSNFSMDARSFAEAVGFSERHLSRIVEAEFGMSLGKFIMLKRLEYAKELLAGNRQLVKDVAATLGFHDTSHFCRVFRHFFGITPKQYVQQQQRAAREPEKDLEE